MILLVLKKEMKWYPNTLLIGNIFFCSPCNLSKFGWFYWNLNSSIYAFIGWLSSFSEKDLNRRNGVFFWSLGHDHSPFPHCDHTNHKFASSSCSAYIIWNGRRLVNLTKFTFFWLELEKIHSKKNWWNRNFWEVEQWKSPDYILFFPKINNDALYFVSDRNVLKLIG